ncbi:MAG: NUDIX hydrolase [Celeribacter sp.]|jgi:8-oxo-dGTP diphosphatase
MLRRYGEPAQPGQSYTFRPGIYALIHRGDEVLLTFQAQPRAEFQFPGGGIDPGEHPRPALHREVLEETGWRIAPERRLGAFRRFTYMPDYGIWAEKICHIWLARGIGALHPPTEPDHTAVWLPGREALSLLDNEGEAAFLAAWLTG